jgi:CheY-like chemotaxis protein
MSKYGGLQAKKILLVEDVEMNQYLARYIMESWGCSVDVADNGKMAIDKVSAADYDIVLMDIQMPEMDGMEATRQIRLMVDEAKATVPIVALTANAHKTECETYLRIGMNDWLAKPFEEASLFTVITKNIKANAALTPVVVVANVDVPAGEKLYDLSMVEAVSGGDKTFIVKMMGLFLETVPVTLNDLQTSADRQDWPAVSKHAHKLKSTIDSMSIGLLKKDIRTIENDARKSGDAAQLTQLVNKVIEIMQRVMTQVRSDFGQPS